MNPISKPHDYSHYDYYEQEQTRPIKPANTLPYYSQGQSRPMPKQNYRKPMPFHKAPYMPTNTAQNYSNYPENEPYYFKQAPPQRGNQIQYPNSHIPHPSYNYPSIDDSFCNYDYYGPSMKRYEEPVDPRYVAPAYNKHCDPYYEKYPANSHAKYPYYYYDTKLKGKDCMYDYDYDYDVEARYRYEEYQAYNYEHQYAGYEPYDYYYEN